MAKRLCSFLLFLLGVFALAYLCDVLLWIARGTPTAAVMVHPYTVVPQKNKRDEYLFDEKREQTCDAALLPHRGLTPCWYLKRHPEIKTEL